MFHNLRVLLPGFIFLSVFHGLLFGQFRFIFCLDSDDASADFLGLYCEGRMIGSFFRWSFGFILGRDHRLFLAEPGTFLFVFYRDLLTAFYRLRVCVHRFFVMLDFRLVQCLGVSAVMFLDLVLYRFLRRRRA